MRENLSAVPGVRCVRQAAKCGRTASGILLAGMSAVWLTGILVGLSGDARSPVNHLDGLLMWSKIVAALAGVLILAAAASMAIAVMIALVYELVACIGDRFEALFEWSLENARRLAAGRAERLRHPGITTLAIEPAEPGARAELVSARAAVVSWTTSVKSANAPADAARLLANFDHVAASVLTGQRPSLVRPQVRVGREVQLRAHRFRRSPERPGDVLVRHRARETPWPRGSLEANRRVVRTHTFEERPPEEPPQMRNSGASVSAPPSGHRYAP